MNRTLLLSSLVIPLWAALSCASGLAAAPESVADQPKLSVTDAITKDGITWKFSEKVKVGQFVNGDYYVVGPVTIVDVTPKAENDRNGSVLNLPAVQDRSGFDIRTEGNRYDPKMRVYPPIHMKPGDSLVSSISVDKMKELPAPLRPEDKDLSPVRTVSILNCLAKPVPADAFRPSYCDHSQKVFLARNLRRNLLPKLAPVKDTPSYQEWAERFRRPWIDTLFFGFDAPAEYMPHYGREIARAVSIAGLMLTLDVPQKEKDPLLIGFVQYGIDLWGAVQAGYPGWQAHGGHGNGRKWPIVFAGIMLGDKDMQSPYARHPNLRFSEDMQTIYGKGWTGDTALYGGHVGPDGEKVGPGWGAYEHLQPREWKSMMNESYRRCCTSLAWVGEALAIRLMNARKQWDHPAFFDYVDRWMTQDDTEFIKIVKEQTGADFSDDWARQRQTWDPFVMEMWAKYRGPVAYRGPIRPIEPAK